MFGGAAAIAIALATLLAPPLVTDAAAASCSALHAKLASVGTARPNRAKSAPYQRSIDRQRAELSRTRKMAARAGCRGDGGGRQCRKITSAIKDMEGRLAELNAQRRKALGGSGSRATRRSIEARMKRQGCDGPRQTRSASLRKVETRRPAPAASIARPDGPKPPAADVGGGSYRTVCVRTCDGYFFPIRDATTRASFRGDAAHCAAMCPAAKTKLFVHRQPGGAETMVDRLGRPYRSMPYAFRHTEQSYRPSTACSCGRPQLAVTAKAKLRGAAGEAVPTPAGIATRDADSETARNDAVGFDWASAGDLLARASATGTARRPVRVVGPRFLPDR